MVTPQPTHVERLWAPGAEQVEQTQVAIALYGPQWAPVKYPRQRQLQCARTQPCDGVGVDVSRAHPAYLTVRAILRSFFFDDGFGHHFRHRKPLRCRPAELPRVVEREVLKPRLVVNRTVQVK